MQIFHKAVATVFGLGYAPFAPGTFGTFGACALLYLGCYLFGGVSTIALVVAILLTSIIGIWSTDQVIPDWGDDPSRVVVDEAAGLLVTIMFVPVTLQSLLYAFILFRFFDILKPLGIRYLDKHIKGGLGVMLDDILAGIYACITLHLIHHFILPIY